MVFLLGGKSTRDLMLLASKALYLVYFVSYHWGMSMASVELVGST